MKLRLSLCVLVIGLAIFLYSCSDKAKVPVPVDASFIIHFNGASLHSKLSWDEIKQSELFKKVYADVKEEELKKILDNPDASGIDIKTDAYLFAKKRGNGSYVVFTCEIKDEKALNSLVEKLNTKDKPVKDGDLSVIKSDKGVITWDGDRLVAIGNGDKMNGSAMSKFGKRNMFSQNQGFPTDSLLKFAKEIYDLEKDESIASNDKFNSLIKEAGDVHFWSNSSALANSLPEQAKMLSKATSLLDSNITAATLNFENGKIAVNAKTYFNSQLAAIFNKHQAKNIDENMLRSIPANDVAAVLAVNYPPEGLKEFLSTLGVDGLLNMVLANANYSFDDFIKGNKGDLLLAVTDFRVNNDALTFAKNDEGDKKSKLNANFLFATSINDKASFQKLTDLLTSMIKDAPVKNLPTKFPYKLTDNWFVAGNDPEQVNSFGTGSANHAFISKISGHPVGGYVDIQKLIAGTSTAVKDSSASIITSEALKYWQDMTFYCDNYKNNVMESHMEVNMVDKNTNSLKQLWNFTNVVGQNMKSHEHELKKKLRKLELKELTDSVSAQ